MVWLALRNKHHANFLQQGLKKIYSVDAEIYKLYAKFSPSFSKSKRAGAAAVSSDVGVPFQNKPIL
jgi:hypothetical protein